MESRIELIAGTPARLGDRRPAFLRFVSLSPSRTAKIVELKCSHVYSFRGLRLSGWEVRQILVECNRDFHDPSRQNGWVASDWSKFYNEPLGELCDDLA